MLPEYLLGNTLKPQAQQNSTDTKKLANAFLNKENLSYSLQKYEAF